MDQTRANIGQYPFRTDDYLVTMSVGLLAMVYSSQHMYDMNKSPVKDTCRTVEEVNDCSSCHMHYSTFTIGCNFFHLPYAC